MKKILLVLLILSTHTFALPLKSLLLNTKPSVSVLSLFPDLLMNSHQKTYFVQFSPIDPQTYYKAMLQREAKTLNPDVINKALMTLHCAAESGVQYGNIFSIIDYSKPSNEKRLWIFDLASQKLLYHTYVSHGLKNGERWSQSFSNKQNSKASSLGLYLTQGIYYGREGISLKLDGLEHGFNDNANNRYIVMHGGWYVNENFIKKYARAGRSWGCPALPKTEVEEIIRTLADRALMLAYFPDINWLSHSKFLHCQNNVTRDNSVYNRPFYNGITNKPESYDPIIYADLKQRDHYLESNPVMVIKAGNYSHEFQRVPPLSRMLRRQINQEEYIVLTPNELNQIIKNNTDFSRIYFIIPVIKMVRGYYETTMQPVPIGKINKIETNGEKPSQFTAHLNGNNKTIQLKTYSGFIRWIGL